MEKLKLIVLLLAASTFVVVKSDKSEEKAKDAWKKKDVRDFNERDLEKLYEQWEEDEEPLPADELPDWDPRKPKPQLDLSDMSKFKEAEDFLKMSKKGQSVMMFVSVSGNPTRREAEELTGIWQTGLWNTHIHVERFMIEDHRALFLFKDGSLAWDSLEYLLEQERCADVQLEQKTYHGYHTEEGKKEKAEKEAKTKKQAGGGKKKSAKKTKSSKNKDEL